VAGHIFPEATRRFNSTEQLSMVPVPLTRAECSAPQALLLERWIHVSVLEHLLQIRPYAQVCDVIGDSRKSMRHVLRDDDDVARLYYTACVSHHCPATRRTVQDCRYFGVRCGTPPVDNGAAGDQCCAIPRIEFSVEFNANRRSTPESRTPSRSLEVC
jgi:hypothetical protein